MKKRRTKQTSVARPRSRSRRFRNSRGVFTTSVIHARGGETASVRGKKRVKTRVPIKSHN